jgi:hypothetical protein
MSGESLEQLGAAIKVMVQKSDDYLISAGLKLIEARRRIDAGEADMSFASFLSEHCGGLSRSRAYELIRIAAGRTTVEATRERARRGMASSRAARSMKNFEIMMPSHQGQARGVRNVTDSPGPGRLAAALAAFDALTAVEREQFLAARGLIEDLAPARRASVH